MNTPTPHLIRQQTLHIEMISSEFEGLALQRSLPDWCQYALLPALERVLDCYAPLDGHLIIDRLDIDAGTLALDCLEQDLMDAVLQAVEKFLREHSPQPNKKTLRTLFGNVQHKTQQQAIYEAFFYFLKTGSLPWSFSLPEGSNLEQVMLDFWQEAGIPRFINASIIDVLISETPRKRLVRQFSLVFMNRLLAQLSPPAKQIMAAILTVLHNATVPPEKVRYFERQLWETVFAAVVAGDDYSLTEMKLVSAAWHSLPAPTEQHGAALGALAELLEKHWQGVTATQKTVTPHPKNSESTTPDILAAEKNNLITEKSAEQIEADKAFNNDLAQKKPLPLETPLANKVDESIASGKGFNKASAQKTNASQQLHSKTPVAESSVNPVDEQREKDLNNNSEPKNKSAQQILSATFVSKKKSPHLIEKHQAVATDQVDQQTLFIKDNRIDTNDSVDITAGIYVNCAGLILLHPFLPQFFEALGIVADDKLVQPDRALCLLHFLAAGQLIAPEYELILPKILCNIPLDTPVESVLTLLPTELEESTALLEAVIQHWDALRNTSIDG
jgi:hypothetical protein